MNSLEDSDFEIVHQQKINEEDEMYEKMKKQTELMFLEDDAGNAGVPPITDS